MTGFGAAQVRRYRSERRGFTLVELLVVISVIGLLISISAPSLHRARTVAKRTNCMANLRSIGQGLQSYLVLSNDYCPYASGYPVLPADKEAYCQPADPEDDCELPPIYEVLSAELGHQREVFRCPADRLRKTLEDRPSRDTYYASLGTSYEWDVFHNGRRREQTYWTRPAHVHVSQEMMPDGIPAKGLGWKVSDVVLMNDYEAFHGAEGERGTVVYLYSDLHVDIDRYLEPETEPPPPEP